MGSDASSGWLVPDEHSTGVSLREVVVGVRKQTQASGVGSAGGKSIMLGALGPSHVISFES